MNKMKLEENSITKYRDLFHEFWERNEGDIKF